MLMLKSSINSDELSKQVFVDKPYFYIVFENIKNNVLWQTGKSMNHTAK